MVVLDTNFLDQAMPLHLRFDSDSRIVHIGPTLAKFFPDRDFLGCPIDELVRLRQIGADGAAAALLAHAGQRLSLVLTSLPDFPMRGQCLPLPGGTGGILNISLGLSFAEAVEAYSLTMSDFSPCDQTVDLLYLREAILAVAAESKRLTDRLVASEQQATMRALTDELTGLANRRAFGMQLERLVSANELPFSIMQLDLDHFKEINDEHGHHAGDEVLRRVAHVLRRAIRDRDVAARMGGDEFVLLIRETDDPNQLDGIASRILRALREPLEVDGVSLSIGSSIGTTRSSLYAQPDVDQMLRDADEALYASKRQGRGRNCYYLPPGFEDRALP